MGTVFGILRNGLFHQNMIEKYGAEMLESPIECTAWDLISGEYTDFIDTTHLIQIGNGGTTFYEGAVLTRNQKIRVGRIVPSGTSLRVINRYLNPDTLVTLIPVPLIDTYMLKDEK